VSALLNQQCHFHYLGAVCTDSQAKQLGQKLKHFTTTGKTAAEIQQQIALFLRWRAPYHYIIDIACATAAVLWHLHRRLAWSSPCLYEYILRCGCNSRNSQKRAINYLVETNFFFAAV